MENLGTYTYTARSADDPDQVVTFTLQDHRMVIDVGVPLEHVERALRRRQATEREEAEVEGEGAAAEIEPYSYSWLKPMVVSLLERGTRPFNIGDVSVKAEDEGLWVTAWARASGLRLAPVVFGMSRVDNPEAAEAFAREVKKRKESVPSPRRFPGFMDYWASWLFASFATVTLLVVWLWSREKEGE